MYEISMASFSATIHKTGTVQFGNELSNFWWHAVTPDCLTSPSVRLYPWGQNTPTY